MKLSDGDRALIAFALTLVAIVALRKFGSTGTDLAIVTALVAVLGTVANNFRRSPPPEKDKP